MDRTEKTNSSVTREQATALSYESLDAVGKMMIDSAKVFATAGVRVTDAYLMRLLNRRKTSSVPEI